MAEYRRHEIYSGLFVFLALLVFALFAFRVGRFDLGGLLKGDVLACRAYFTDVKTLQPGAEVKVGGQTVGEVTAVHIVERALTAAQAARLTAQTDSADAALEAGMVRPLIQLDFELSDPELRLERGSASVTLSQSSLLTAHYLELDPGRWRPSEPPPRALDRARAVDQSPVVIETREGGGFEEIVARAKPLVGEAADLLRTLRTDLLTEENTASIGRIIGDLESSAADLRQLAEDGRRLVAGEEGADLETLIGRTQALALRLDETVATLARDAHGLLERGQSVLDRAGGVFDSADGVIDENRLDVARAVRSLRQAMWHAELALRRIRTNPAVLLFGDDEPDLEAAPQDESALRYSGRVGPYGQRDEADE